MGRILLLTVFSGFLLSFHPLHVSVCEIDFDRDRKALEITHRIFFDDMEQELRKEMGNENLDIVDGINRAQRDELFEAYLKRHVSIKLDGIERNYEYLGNERVNDAYFLYYQVLEVEELNKIGVKNDVLLDIFDDQVNMVHVSEGDKVKSMRMMRNSRESEITF